MNNKTSFKVPVEIEEKLWTRYLPETTYKMLALIGQLQEKNIVGKRATDRLLNSHIKAEGNIPKVVEEKKSILKKIGFEYPETREDDLKLLLEYKLIEKDTNDKDEEIYKFSEDIKGPVEVLNLDEEEKETLENIEYEMNHEQALNMVLTLILNNSGKLTCSVDHITKTTRVKLTEVKDVLDYLVNTEGSVKIIADKKIQKLKKQDKVYITLNEEVFNKKRLVV